MLGEDIDKKLQLYLQKVRDQGGVITASVGAHGILLFYTAQSWWNLVAT